MIFFFIKEELSVSKRMKKYRLDGYIMNAN